MVGVVIVQLALAFQIVQLLLVALILLTVFLLKFQVRILEFSAYHVLPVLLVFRVILVTPLLVCPALVPHPLFVKLVCGVIVGRVILQLVSVL